MTVINLRRYYYPLVKDKAEQWRAAWAEYANRALEQTGRPERIDHRSYKRQGVELLPTVHMGVAATRMEQRGIATDKGNVNRQIAADNKLLKEIKREKFAERHGAELALYESAVRFLNDLKATGEAVTPKQWRAEADTLTAKKDVLYSQMRAMREEVKAVEQLSKAAEQLAKTQQPKHKEEPDR